MFYDTEKNDHGLPFNPYKSIVVPRPIGWISSLDPDGNANLAPYSQFNNLGYDPPYVMFSASHRPDTGAPKDSVANIIRTREFVCNLATYDLRKAVVKSAENFPPDVDEMEAAGVTKEASQLVKPPRVAESPVHLECRLYTVLVLPGYAHQNTTHVVVGQVVGVHIRDDALTAEGKLNVARLRPLARLGYQDYSSVTEIFDLPIGGPMAEALVAGLGGEAKGKR
ncbi:MAG: flavin reductase family protein [Rickettsiales bacterium]